MIGTLTTQATFGIGESQQNNLDFWLCYAVLPLFCGAEYGIIISKKGGVFVSIQVSDAGTEIYNPPKDNKAAWAWKKAYDGQARVLSKAMTKVHEQAEKLAAINKLDKPMDIHLSAADKLEAAKTGNRVITRCPNCKSDISESNSTRVTDYKYCPYCRQALNFKIQV